MRKTKRKDKANSDELSKKRNKLDRATFNFLENLCVFCIMTERRVPKESGNRFRISVPTNAPICLLACIDRPSDPLIQGQIPRPDYLCIFINRGECLCTIIEMKGTTEKGLKHGIEQIRALRTRLLEEVKRHLPTKIHIVIQGILLTPYNSDIPRKLIEKEASNGLVILPLQYDHQAELFDYISRQNRLYDRNKSVRYSHNAAVRDRNFGIVETLLAFKALPRRLSDSLYSEHFVPTRERQGMYINFDPIGSEEYTVLALNSAISIIATRGEDKDTIRKIMAELNEAGINRSIEYQVFQQ